MKNIKVTSICGLIACGLAFFVLIICCLNGDGKEVYIGFVVIVLLMIVPLIFACINISKFRGLKKLDPNNDNIETARKLNLSFVILGFSCVPFILLLYFLLSKIDDICCCFNKLKGAKNIDTTTNKSTENKPNESQTNINK